MLYIEVYKPQSCRNSRTHRKILKISSISESPGKSGFRVHISAKMQPTDHISTPVEYCRPPSKISGARYHSVTTYYVLTKHAMKRKDIQGCILHGCKSSMAHQTPSPDRNQ